MANTYDIRDAELRLECLQMAQAEGFKGADTIQRARELMTFVESGAVEVPRGAETPPRANVRGKDGKFEPPFDDYIRDRGNDT